MRVDLGTRPFIYPQPVLMIGTYDENGNPDVMNAAWGGPAERNQVFFCLDPNHKTVKNFLKTCCFTVSIAVEGYEVPCDYLGIASGNSTPDKVSRSGLHVRKADHVNAPLIEELPVCLECRVASFEFEHRRLIGEIIASSIDERILTDGKIDITKLRPLIYDYDMEGYYGIGEYKGDAFSIGAELK